MPDDAKAKRRILGVPLDSQEIYLTVSEIAEQAGLGGEEMAARELAEMARAGFLVRGVDWRGRAAFRLARGDGDGSGRRTRPRPSQRPLGSG